MATRTETDSLGEMQVPAEALYGAQTARAVENFPISGQGIGREMIRALARVKLAAVRVNRELGRLEAGMASFIEEAAREVIAGRHDGHFPVDVFQTGSGTSSNMNMNEVIANRAGQLGGIRIHPNDHVNLGQSSNDVFPTALHLAARVLIGEKLMPALARLQKALEDKAGEFHPLVKTGRTHLQDATPIRLGQEFSGFVSQLEHARGHLQDACGHLEELAIGGTAVGTGVNTHPLFGRRVAEDLSAQTGFSFQEAPNHFEAQAAQDAAVQLSGALKTLAVGLIKMANDIRWLGSGPRLGLGELILPAVQPGSSIMPGKVNPVMAEALIMVAAQVIGNDAAISLGGLYGNFQLNTMLPLIARNLLEQIRLLANAADAFAAKTVSGLRADRRRIETDRRRSLALATALAPRIGYDAAAEIAKLAHQTGATVLEVARQKKTLPEAELQDLLDPGNLTGPKE